MIQYLTMTSETIKGKDGENITVKGFRKRVKYDTKDIFLTKMTQDLLLRPDLFCYDNYGFITRLSGLMDVNDEDIFSFDINEQINYANPDKVY